MKKRILGKTNLKVTPLGFGSSQAGILNTDLEDAGKILNGVLDLGINLIDTASCYGKSEEMIGKFIASRRDQYILVSKCGHSSGSIKTADWTKETLEQNVQRSLKLMNTDHLDILLLHTCSAQQLKEDWLIQSITKFKEKGLTKHLQCLNIYLQPDN